MERFLAHEGTVSRVLEFSDGDKVCYAEGENEAAAFFLEGGPSEDVLWQAVAGIAIRRGWDLEQFCLFGCPDKGKEKVVYVVRDGFL